MADGRLLASLIEQFSLDVISPSQGKEDTLTFPVDYGNSQRSLAIHTLIEAEPGEIWFGSYPAYLSHYSFNSQQTEHFRVPLNKQKHGAVLDLAIDPDANTLWLAMSEGLRIFDLTAKQFQPVKQNFNGPLRLIHRDNMGNIWTGNKSGLYVWKKQTQQWHHFSSQHLSLIHI